MINIAKLLKDAPKGMKLYSPLLGEVEFAEVMDTGYMPIRVMKRGYGLRFDKYGRYMGNEYPDAECVLFPSKEVRTWEGWKLPAQPNFKVGDWIACIDDEGDVAIEKIVCFVHNKVLLVDVDGCFTEYPKTELNNFHLWTIADAKDGDVLAADECYVIFKEVDGLNIKCYCTYHYIGFNPIFYIDTLQNKTAFRPATQEQREWFFKKMKEAGYQWDSEKKELEKIKSHYNIENFHAGMPVLVRADDNCKWDYSVFSRITGNVDWNFAVCNGVSVTQCIPFEDNEHLLGTTDPCDERYINW